MATLPVESARPRSSVAASLPIGSTPVGAQSPATGAGPSGEPSGGPSAPAEEPSEEPMSGTAGPGCGTGQLGLFSHRDEVPEVLRFGGATIEFTGASVSMRNGTYDASDSIPGGIGLSPDEIAVVVGPGERIILRAVGLTLDTPQARAYPWGDVDFDGGLASMRGHPIELAWRRRSDGSLSVAAPEVSGDYAVEFVPRWAGTCLAGDGVAYGRIKVR